MSFTTKPSTLPIGFWTVCLGLAGFVAGFLGPMLLNPGANQGPMLGIFITGPGGALTGLVFGLLVRQLPLSVQGQWQALMAISTVMVLAILYFCLPEPLSRGYVLEAEIKSCVLPAAMVDVEIKRREEDARRYAYQPRAGWQMEMRQKAAEADAVVVELQVTRKRHVYALQKPWNKGKLLFDSWKDENETRRYYAREFGRDCAHYPAQGKGIYFANDNSSDVLAEHKWPPENLANFLGLQNLETAAAQYRNP